MHWSKPREAADLGVIDRCNLTVLFEAGQQDTARFLAEHAVKVVASLPCYLEDNVDAQRGDGVFGKSIAALRLLNTLGYGRAGSGLELDLVYNPQGATLPPPQQALEADYRRHLADEYGVVFSRLLTLANMPIMRFGSTLVSRGEFNGLPAAAQGGAPGRESRRGDVPFTDQHRLAGLRLRLRFQPDA